jgi:hypothetical protein
MVDRPQVEEKVDLILFYEEKGELRSNERGLGGEKIGRSKDQYFTIEDE